ncbi:hypothetical protein EIN_310050 [Entamoeba invadens IP1]|uniref:Uncharacterized protein n=1 Tax=Entamoeba invadens IP1 TaxID=370355 RepID=A0A0A1TWD1_ENTIV|nr:hypothetical protein EIN_310050 [Entamoeba invadens IP1]ELP84972.1 hypothetical protein EIN_310050 [Entamoeba invadens IP1]|eukprot:XP_004184318.1 hypothetical protein EIN_310050 [Entamoeba invadens IP1]
MANYIRIKYLRLWEKIVIPVVFILVLGLMFGIGFGCQDSHKQSFVILKNLDTEGIHYTNDLPTFTAVDKKLRIDLHFSTAETGKTAFFTNFNIVLYRQGKDIGHTNSTVIVECQDMVCNDATIVKEDVILGRGQSIDLTIPPVVGLQLDTIKVITNGVASSYLQMTIIAVNFLLNFVLGILLLVYLMKKGLLATFPIEAKLFILGIVCYGAPLDIFSYIVETWVFPIFHGVFFVLFIATTVFYIIKNNKTIHEGKIPIMKGMFDYIIIGGISLFFLIVFIPEMLTYIIYEWTHPVSVDDTSIRGVYITFCVITAVCSFILLSVVALNSVLTAFFAKTQGNLIPYLVEQGILLFILFYAFLEIGVYPQSFLINGIMVNSFFNIPMQFFFILYFFLFTPTDESFEEEHYHTLL